MSIRHSAYTHYRNDIEPLQFYKVEGILDTPQTILEAIEFMIDTNVHRYNRKTIACMLRPTMKAESAKAWLTHCLDPEKDFRFTPQDVDRICEITGRADIYMNFLADRHGFERTAKKVILNAENEVIILRQALQENGLDPEECLNRYIEEHKNLFAVAFKKGKNGE